MPVFRDRPTKQARSLRNDATDCERLLWSRLRGRQMLGFKFSRQMPVGPFICDFMCREAKLVIEVDGGQHAEQIASDTARTNFIQLEGYEVLRFWNNDVLSNLDGVLQNIQTFLENCPPPAPPAGGSGAK